MRLKVIARVANGITDDTGNWDRIESTLVFGREFRPGLYRLSRCRHVWVIFGFHRSRGWKARVHPMHDPRRPLVGVFSSRSPRRPNRLGLALVELLSVKGNKVTVRGLDALDGSPVFDIKPYVKEMDGITARARKNR